MFRRKLTDTQLLRKEICFRIQLGQLFGETKVEEFWNTPNPGLENKSPMYILYFQERPDLLEKMIHLIGSGEPLS